MSMQDGVPGLPPLMGKQAVQSVDEVTGGTLFGVPFGLSGPVVSAGAAALLAIFYSFVEQIAFHATVASLRMDPVLTTLLLYISGNVVLGGTTNIVHLFQVRGPIARAYAKQGVYQNGINPAGSTIPNVPPGAPTV